MKKILTIVALIFSSHSFSNELYSFDSFEIELKVGASNYGLDCTDCDIIPSYGLGISTDKDKDLFLNAYFQNNETFNYKDSNLLYDLDSYSLNSTINYNFYKNNNFSGYFTGGLSYWNNKSIGMNNTDVFSKTSSGISPLVGIGLNYKMNKNIRIGLEYNYLFLMDGYNEFGIKDVDSNSIYLTFSYIPSIKTKIIHKEKEIVKEILINSPQNQYSVFFDFDKSIPESLHSIDLAIDTINSIHDNHEYIIYLIGHSSNLGTDIYNNNLSKERVLFVKNKLKEKVSANNRIVVEYYGKKYTNDKAFNQRVDVIIKKINKPDL